MLELAFPGDGKEPRPLPPPTRPTDIFLFIPGVLEDDFTIALVTAPAPPEDFLADFLNLAPPATLTFPEPPFELGGLAPPVSYL